MKKEIKNLKDKERVCREIKEGGKCHYIIMSTIKSYLKSNTHLG